MSIKSAIFTEAHRLGFHLVGVTTPAPPDHINVYQRWLQSGHHGQMGYLSTARSLHRRKDPRSILPECQSILVLGTPYSPRAETLEDYRKYSYQPGSVHGRISSYAWGKDYHEVIEERLILLVKFIERKTGSTIPNRYYTDTGSLLERELAQRAGLGWIGKNTCLINPRSGSYFFLSEILLGLPLEPNHPTETDNCGTCRRCIDACPTSCILDDRTLDARRCISYLTIELKETIPVELRPKIGNWVFGCDICQQVCPWNRFAPREGDPAFAAPVNSPDPDLIQNLSMTPEQFNRTFKESPIRRTKRRGYLRNTAVAIGNSLDPATIPALADSLQTELEPLIRSHAAWALGQIKSPRAFEALKNALQFERDESVIKEIKASLKLIP